jgi:hypothetical protein
LGLPPPSADRNRAEAEKDRQMGKEGLS